MDEVYGCERARELLPELALGAVSGHERAEVLRHVGECAACRAELAELSKVADSMLLLAPEAEPLGGFESRVMSRIAKVPQGSQGPQGSLGAPGPTTRRRLLTLAASVLVAASLSAGAVWWETAPDRRLAEQTRQTMDVAGGRYLKAVTLTTDSGTEVGTIFLYQGNDRPSWLLVSVDAAPADGSYDVVLTNRDGKPYPIGACEIKDGTGTVAYQVKGSLENIGSIRMTGPGDIWLVARA
ncbi:MAG TPA: zf-HC2 domain-containing protein [Candidatus Limnocylindrales bacterium]